MVAAPAAQATGGPAGSNQSCACVEKRQGESKVPAPVSASRAGAVAGACNGSLAVVDGGRIDFATAEHAGGQHLGDQRGDPGEQAQRIRHAFGIDEGQGALDPTAEGGERIAEEQPGMGGIEDERRVGGQAGELRVEAGKRGDDVEVRGGLGGDPGDEEGDRGLELIGAQPERGRGGIHVLDIEAAAGREGQRVDGEGGRVCVEGEIGRRSAPRESAGGSPGSDEFGAVERDADARGDGDVDGRLYAEAQRLRADEGKGAGSRGRQVEGQQLGGPREVYVARVRAEAQAEAQLLRLAGVGGRLRIPGGEFELQRAAGAGDGDAPGISGGSAAGGRRRNAEQAGGIDEEELPVVDRVEQDFAVIGAERTGRVGDQAGEIEVMRPGSRERGGWNDARERGEPAADTGSEFRLDGIRKRRGGGIGDAL